MIDGTAAQEAPPDDIATYRNMLAAGLWGYRLRAVDGGLPPRLREIRAVARSAGTQQPPAGSASTRRQAVNGRPRDNSWTAATAANQLRPPIRQRTTSTSPLAHTWGVY